MPSAVDPEAFEGLGSLENAVAVVVNVEMVLLRHHLHPETVQ